MATVNEKMTAIADAIREKTGGTDTLTLDDMAANIPKVYAEGKMDEGSAWWDAYQSNGTRRNYSFAFAGYGWKDEAFKPKYDIVCSGQNGYLFHNAQISSLKNIGVKIDTSKATDLSYAFYFATTLTECPEIDISSSNYHDGLFCGCAKLHTLDKLILKADGTSAIGGGVFQECSSLQNITIGGAFGKNMSFRWSPLLTVESIESIMSALSDTASGRTMTFNKAAKTTYYNEHSSECSDADAAWDALCDTKPNWTISLV